MKASSIFLFLSLNLVPLQVRAQVYELDWDPTPPIMIGAQKREKTVPLQVGDGSYGLDWDATLKSIQSTKGRTQGKAQMNNSKACELGHSVGNLIGMFLGRSYNADSSYCQSNRFLLVELPDRRASNSHCCSLP